MREKGEEWGDNHPMQPTLYTPRQQARVNKETNNDKPSHMIDLSSNNHMGKENNRAASTRSFTQQCPVILLSHGKRKQ